MVADGRLVAQGRWLNSALARRGRGWRVLRLAAADNVGRPLADHPRASEI